MESGEATEVAVGQGETSFRGKRLSAIQLRQTSPSILVLTQDGSSLGVLIVELLRD